MCGRGQRELEIEGEGEGESELLGHSDERCMGHRRVGVSIYVCVRVRASK